MKVILIDDLNKYGKKNQVIEVSSGFALNFLFPKKLAIPATTENLNFVKRINDSELANLIYEKEELLNIKKIIESITLSFKLEFHNGKSQGTISMTQISEVLKLSHNIDINKKKFINHENIHDKGLHYLKLKLSSEIEATLKVQIDEK